MPETRTPWAIVLAAGEGSRLASLTTGARGGVVPKQFCSLRGGRTLLGEALARARAVAAPERVATVVAAAHRPFWEQELAQLPAHNVIVQPANRGTAAGLLLPLLSVLERDPDALLLVLPSDHHVQSEAVLAVALHLALRRARDEPESVILLGIAPDAPEPDYGWIVPADGTPPLQRIARFVEKPEPVLAAELLAQGGLWNSFLMAGRGQAFVELYARRLPGLLAAFRSCFARAPAERPAALAELYAGLATSDVSRHILQGSEDDLRVVAVPPCGWTDLGTPERVAACVRRAARARCRTVPGARAALVLERALAAAGARSRAAADAAPQRAAAGAVARPPVAVPAVRLENRRAPALR